MWCWATTHGSATGSIPTIATPGGSPSTGWWAARDPFGANIAAGLGSLLLFQITVNIGMVTGIMPVTGIPLPFITYGGSSMISLLFGMGLLQSVRVHAWKPTF